MAFLFHTHLHASLLNVWSTLVSNHVGSAAQIPAFYMDTSHLFSTPHPRLAPPTLAQQQGFQPGLSQVPPTTSVPLQQDQPVKSLSWINVSSFQKLRLVNTLLWFVPFSPQRCSRSPSLSTLLCRGSTSTRPSWASTLDLRCLNLKTSSAPPYSPTGTADCFLTLQHFYMHCYISIYLPYALFPSQVSAGIHAEQPLSDVSHDAIWDATAQLPWSTAPRFGEASVQSSLPADLKHPTHPHPVWAPDESALWYGRITADRHAPTAGQNLIPAACGLLYFPPFHFFSLPLPWSKLCFLCVCDDLQRQGMSQHSNLYSGQVQQQSSYYSSTQSPSSALQQVTVPVPGSQLSLPNFGSGGGQPLLALPQSLPPTPPQAPPPSLNRQPPSNPPYRGLIGQNTHSMMQPSNKVCAQMPIHWYV